MRANTTLERRRFRARMAIIDGHAAGFAVVVVAAAFAGVT
jgi:hypothetical protein